MNRRKFLQGIAAVPVIAFGITASTEMPEVEIAQGKMNRIYKNLITPEDLSDEALEILEREWR